ncbi:Zn-ribbon domain-containing OB-fold protein [Amycolatopsis thermoflava]|uniref:Zn-ribbon domain-containing OB-fold protein n=1 Tax=Amycolatopsis thermoflava TaxID=84480 RepID=UPI0038298440
MTVPGSYGGPALTDEFWAAAAEHVLVRPVCRACGSSFFPPLIACPHCVAQDWEYRSSAGRGTIYSCAVVHKAPSPEFETPFPLAIVDLDGEGWGLLTTIVGAPSPRIGDPVEVTWRESGDRVLPAFRPVSTP